MTSGICGRTTFASSVPAGPLSSWESRLRERLATIGSTEFDLIWREKTTPAGQSISRLAPLTRRISDNASTGSPWPTPLQGDGVAGPRPSDPKRGPLPGLPAAVTQTMWPTPRAHEAGPDYAKRTRSTTGMDLPAVAAEVDHSVWPTPQVDSFRSRSGDRKAEMGLDQLARFSEQPEVAPWPTPTANPTNNISPEDFLRRKGRAPGGAITELPIVAAMTADRVAWPTPTDRDKDSSRRHGYMIDGNPGTTLTDAVDLATWSTPRASDGEKGGPGMQFGAGGTPLPAQAVGTWRTPQAEEGNKGNLNRYAEGERRQVWLSEQAVATEKATWATPMSRDHRSGEASEATYQKNARPLNEQVLMVSGTWPTPTATDHKGPNPLERNPTDDDLPTRVARMAPTGPAPSGSSVRTEKRGALNPAFVCWLMGYPDEWGSCGGTAMQSSRSRRRKSSAR